ncbi:YiiX/YebB-like N1pC/P60 family cysteine hydrolase [Rhizobium sp. P40RR-XXII]|nr:YiiX/YebB-like N1pC/P60 family cysteine hydrolase [Rhizobium sp. P40RR-XXII]
MCPCVLPRTWRRFQRKRSLSRHRASDSENEGRALKRINDAVLRPGDIILTTSAAKVSKGIRFATGSDISHAMVCVEGYSVIDATAEGVQARNTQRLFYKDAHPVHILRLRGGLSKPQLDDVLMFMRGHVGTQYSKTEAMRTKLKGTRPPTRKQFCSRLVAQAFSHAGIPLVSDANFCSPGDLKSSPFLVSVADSTVPVTAEEMAASEARPDGTQIMRDAINAILNGARKKNPNIQTFDDLDGHLIEHPEDDDYICRLVADSGYLVLWKIEQEKNPWIYDLDVMREGPADQISAYCQSVVADEATPNRYIINRAGYRLFAHQHDHLYFKLMASLYDHLATLHNQRVRVAKAWLHENGYALPPESPPLTPHTPEWFASLQQWDPPQAMMTRYVVEQEGSEAVCSVCGDEPAADYALEADERPLGGPGTLRLCDDCLDIRRDGGESYISIT